jgi:hypothetical protein
MQVLREAEGQAPLDRPIVEIMGDAVDFEDWRAWRRFQQSGLPGDVSAVFDRGIADFALTIGRYGFGAGLSLGDFVLCCICHHAPPDLLVEATAYHRC